MSQNSDDPSAQTPSMSPTRQRNDPPTTGGGEQLGRTEHDWSFQSEAPQERPEIPGYEILGELGAGGMGIVYKALQRDLKRLVALKMLRGRGDSDSRQRFRSEVEALARLQHPNIVRVYEVGEYQGQPFCVLEFISHGSLDQFLKSTLPTPREAAALVEQVAHGAHAAHKAGVVHRDLKPGNVLLGEQGEEGASSGGDRSGDTSRGSGSSRGSRSRVLPFVPKITDFGLAKMLDHGAVQLTQTGQLLGTPCYMAPEQASGSTPLIGPAADIWALGAILYECLTGRPPFKGANVSETLGQVNASDPIPPRRLRPEVPRDLETIALKCLQKETRRRYGSALDLADDLKRFLDGKPIQARPISTTERLWKWVRRNPAVAALSLLVVLVSVVGVVLVLSQWREAVTQRDLARAETQAKESALVQKQIALVQTEDARRQAEDARLEAGQERDIARLALRQERALRHAGLLTASRRQAQEGRWTTALDTLDGSPEDQRGWEWHFLHGVLAQYQPRILHGASEHTRHAVFSADGQLLAVVGPNDSNLQVWEAASGHSRAVLAASSGGAQPPVFSPDGNELAGVAMVTYGDGRQTGLFRLWDTKTGRLLYSFEKPGEYLGMGSSPASPSLARTPDGVWLALSKRNWDLGVWDVRAGKKLPILPEGTKVFQAALSPNGRTLAVVLIPQNFASKSIELRDPVTGQVRHTLTGHTEGVHQLLFSPDGRRLASVTHYPQSSARVCELKVWNVEDGKLLHSVTEPANSEFSQISFSGDGSTLGVVVAGPGPRREERPAEVRVYQLANGRNTVVGRALMRDYPQLALDSQGKTLAWCQVPSSREDRRIPIRVLEIPGGKERLQIQAPTGSLRGLAFSPDGQRLVCLRGTSAVGRFYPSDVLVWDLGTADSSRRLIEGHAGGVGALALSPDDAVIASGGPDAAVKLWQAATGQQRHVLNGHTGPVTAVAFRKDGEQVASGGEDATIRLWDPGTGAHQKTLTAFNHVVTGLAYHPRQAELASSGKDGTVRLWDIREGKPLRTLEPGSIRIEKPSFTSVAYSPDGSLLAAGMGLTAEQAELAPVILWSSDGKVKHTLRAHRGIVTGLAFSPDGSRLATAGIDRLIKLWDVPSGRLLVVAPGHADAVRAVAFSPAGDRLFSAGEDGSLRVWDPESGQELLPVGTPGKALVCLAVGARGRVVVTAGAEPQIQVWDNRPSPQRFTFQGAGGGVAGLALRADGKLLATIGKGRLDPATHREIEPATLKIWDAQLGRERLSLPVSILDEDTALGFFPDGERLAGLVWNSDRRATQLVLWDVQSSQIVKVLGSTGLRHQSLAISPQGHLAVTLNPFSNREPGVVHLHDPGLGKPRKLTGARAGLNGVTFSPDGKRLAVASGDYNVYVWETASGKLLQTLTGHQSAVLSVAFSPDGKRLVSGAGDWGTNYRERRPTEVKVWDLDTGREVLTATGHAARVSSVVFSRDGTRILSGSWDRTVKVWDAQTGRCLRTLTGHTDRISSLVPGPDGKRLHSASIDGIVKVWDLESPEE